MQYRPDRQLYSWRLIMLVLVPMILAACNQATETTLPTQVPTLAVELPTRIAAATPTGTEVLRTSTPVPTAQTEVTPTLALTATASVTATGAVTTTAVQPRVFFRQPTNNALLPITSTVIMGYEGLTVEPAGAVKAGAGHMHILVDTAFIPPGAGIPKDDQHLHFGQGQITTTLVLTPGLHHLGLQFADGAHLALDGPHYQDEITVTVDADAPAQAVRFVTPDTEAIISSPFEVVMAATGLIVEPAGEIHENAGHLHILVDTDFIPAGQGIPKDEHHLHFGQGQLTAMLELPPGEHTLRLQFADGNHVALEGDQYRAEITVKVE
jgi:hypothetical protein